jgi:glycosyltransferase involved in cell wall biosynthesis
MGRNFLVRNWKCKKSSVRGTVAANIITKNEEKNIVRCIRSVQDVVDEIIVVDTGSIDDTMIKAINAGARIGQMKWDDDFSGPRNKAIEMSKTDWILSIDADEVLPERGKEEIREMASMPKVAGWHIDTMTYLKSPMQLDVRVNDNKYKEGKEFPYFVISTKTRMFQKSGGIKWRFPVHELIDTSIIEAGGKFRKAEIKVQHLHKEGKPEDLKKKADFYLRLCEKKVRANQGMGHAWGELAVCELQSGLFVRAARSYYAAITRGEANSKNRYGYAGVLRLLGAIDKSDLEIERAICLDFPNLTHIEGKGK